MIKCPYCGSTEFKIINSTEKCIYCGGVIESDKNVFKRQEFNNDNKTTKTDNKLSATKIWDICSKSICCIECGNAAGTGFLIDDKGKVVTNKHVVNYDNNFLNKKVYCYFDHKRYLAKIEYISSKEDIAILNIGITNLKPLKLSDSNKVKVGEEIFIIGNSNGEGLCMKRGIISDINRVLNDGNRYIMSDISTVPGNSGSPLLNNSGEVIGLFSRGAMDMSENGMEFSIPINSIKTILR